jgi:PAS domain S-box-containing protein
MTGAKPYLKHVAISFAVLIILCGIVFAVFALYQNEIGDQTGYLQIACFVIAVLASYVFYLLLAAKSRGEMVVWEATKQLMVSREQFKRLYEDAPVPYVKLDLKGLIHEPNKATLRFFGVLPEEIENKNFFTFHPDEDLELGKKLLQRFTLNVPINREEIRMITKSGEVRTILLTVFETRDTQTLGRMGIASIFDITEQKKLDKAKTEFVSLASHQLRTPLATMKWFMDMLLSGDIGELPDKQKEYVQKLYTVNGEMAELVDILLNVSRIEIGALVLDKKKANAVDIAESILTELSSQIARKYLIIDKRYGNALQDITTDPKLLRIVIQNLVSNSVKYTPDGGTITITFTQTGSQGQIIITDTGMGIPREQQDKIFTKLFRADNVRTQSAAQGTGLGLYLVKSIIEALGGSISFTSEEGKGSVFTITLYSL